MIKQMTDTRVKQLLLYKTSAKYLDRMTAALQQKAGQEAKFRRWVAHAVCCLMDILHLPLLHVFTHFGWHFRFH